MLAAQSEGLAALRSRLLRGAQVATRSVIVDLGAGAGAVVGELVQRGARPGRVVAVDEAPDFLALPGDPFDGAERVLAKADALPFPDGSVDLVFAQFALLWMPVPAVVAEIARVLRPGGCAVCIEPDVGGMLQVPDGGLREVWERALRAAGADPHVGRTLPGLLEAQGFAVRVEITPELRPTRGVDLLAGLPLSDEDKARIAETKPPSWQAFCWTPIFGVLATKPG